MAVLLPFILLIILVIIANLVAASSERRFNRLFDTFLILMNIPVFLVGVLLFFLPPEMYSGFITSGFPGLNIQAARWVFIGMGLWGILASLYPARKILSPIASFDADSPIHTLALMLGGYLIGNTALALTQDVLVELAETSFAVTVFDVFIQQLGFFVIAFVGVGILIRRDIKSTLDRLGLVRPTWNQVLLAIISVIFLVVLQGVAGALWLLLDPEQAEFLGDLNESLLAGFDTIGEWLVLAISSGVGEEVLFRGAIQPIFGVWPTSLLFAIVHIQYGFTPATLTVFLLGLFLGYLRKYTNTSVAILVHFGYNFTLGLFSLLAVYLDQFIS